MLENKPKEFQPTVENNKIEKALLLVNTFANGDTETARMLLAEDYIQHNTAYETGANAIVDAIVGLSMAPNKTTVYNIRAFEDGDKVFLQTIYNFAGQGDKVAFDIFRFENGVIVEHWDNLSDIAADNPSGHSQIDGATIIKDFDKKEENRELVSNFIYDILQGNNLDKLTTYFDGNNYVQHNSSFADGLDGLGAALASLAKAGISMDYYTVHQVLTQGNYVLTVSEGAFGGQLTSYYDLFRVENNKIAEYWDVMETLTDSSTWNNSNGKY